MEQFTSPLGRIKPKDLDAAGVIRLPITTAASHGKPVMEDGRIVDVANVVWCTGFDPDLGTYAEVRPTARAVIDDLLARDAVLRLVSLTPEGRALAVSEI